MPNASQPPERPLDPIVAFFGAVPHADALGIEFLRRDGEAYLYRLPWREDLVGNPDSGTLHSSVIFAFLDSIMGFSTVLAVAPERSTATMDLRVDYMRASEPGKAVEVRVECYRVAHKVAFARGVAYHDDPAEPLATAQGAFMIYDTPPEWRRDRAQ